ncbi:transcription termination factor MTERF9, chloroplastic-like isoform X2 [Cucumis sativus]|uniref:transcription termination factor MTERF9, chloroplastic-like isoform X2 n=1 Tax=Cucumis sativus TaxID=3659 RepID=UPI0012F4BBD0|nr:transcription termination factor MTERF9, chloroplastic-like isoform X2 [Cucumis sativus]
MFKISSTFLLHFIHKRSLNTVSTSTLPLPSVSTIQFLTNSCGLSSGSPTSKGRKLQFDGKSIQKYEAIIGFLKSHGFENSQIAKLVSKQPSILQSKVSNNLKPKFEFLQEVGFVGPLLPKLILSNPGILIRSLDSQLKPTFFILKEILGEKGNSIKNSCGLSTESPSSAGRKLRIDEKNIQQYEAIVGFFKSHGFENSQIAKLVSRQPSILQSTVSTNLKPKFEFLQENGFVGPLLPKLILSNPGILIRSLDSQLKPTFRLIKEMLESDVKEILESDEQVTAAICRSPRLLICDLKGNFKSSADVLASEGVPSRNITKMITLNPRTFMQKADRVIGAVKTVKELGIEPKARMFIYALFVRLSMNDSTWKKKINVMESLGWSEKEIF